MHRVDAEGYTTVGGERRFIDRLLPAEEGTVDGAYWNNAIQEEIVTIVEHAGLTLRTSGAADQTAGWDQLKEAIFDSAAITGAAITNASIGLAKLTSGTAPSLVDSLLPMTNTGGTKSATYSETGAGVSIVDIGSIQIKGDGIVNYVENLGSGGVDVSLVERDVVIRIDASGWSWVAEGDDYVSTPVYELGRVANSVMGTGAYGSYSATLIGYSSTISAQVSQTIHNHWVSYDGSGNATLEKVYTHTSPNSYAGLYCYIRLHRVDV